MGRPPGPAERVRNRRVSVMVTEAEYRELERRAEKADLPAATVLYNLVTKALRRRSG